MTPDSGAHMAEQWRKCVGFEDYYEISDSGNARRVGNTTNLSKVINKDGYVAYCFSCNSNRRNVLAHRLVADAFIGPCPPGQVVRHQDGTQTNNSPLNLSYGYPADNSADMCKHGTQAMGEKQHLAKLDAQKVAIIKRSMLSNKELAKHYGVTPAAIWCIRTGKTWKHV